MNAAHTLCVWMQTVEGGFATWELVSVALLFLRWVASHLPSDSSAETGTPIVTAKPVNAR